MLERKDEIVYKWKQAVWHSAFPNSSWAAQELNRPTQFSKSTSVRKLYYKDSWNLHMLKNYCKSLLKHKFVGATPEIRFSRTRKGPKNQHTILGQRWEVVTNFLAIQMMCIFHLFVIRLVPDALMLDVECGWWYFIAFVSGSWKSPNPPVTFLEEAGRPCARTVVKEDRNSPDAWMST